MVSSVPALHFPDYGQEVGAKRSKNPQLCVPTFSRKFCRSAVKLMMSLSSTSPSILSLLAHECWNTRRETTRGIWCRTEHRYPKPKIPRHQDFRAKKDLSDEHIPKPCRKLFQIFWVRISGVGTRTRFSVVVKTGLLDQPAWTSPASLVRHEIPGLHPTPLDQGLWGWAQWSVLDRAFCSSWSLIKSENPWIRAKMWIES